MLSARRRATLFATVATLVALAFSASAPAAQCEGDECQGPPPAPEEVVPGTAVVEGPPNPPVHYPKETGHSKNKKPAKHKPAKHKKHGKRHRGRS